MNPERADIRSPGLVVQRTKPGFIRLINLPISPRIFAAYPVCRTGQNDRVVANRQIEKDGALSEHFVVDWQQDEDPSAALSVRLQGSTPRVACVLHAPRPGLAGA